MHMKITNVTEIFDNDEFVTIVTKTGVAVHLPVGQHSITIQPHESPSRGWVADTAMIDFFVE